MPRPCLHFSSRKGKKGGGTQEISEGADVKEALFVTIPITLDGPQLSHVVTPSCPQGASPELVSLAERMPCENFPQWLTQCLSFCAGGAA